MWFHKFSFVDLMRMMWWSIRNPPPKFETIVCPTCAGFGRVAKK